MSKKPSSESIATNCRKRVILAPQSAGRIGKSTAAEAIVTWMQFAGIDNVLFDLDAEHLTITNRYPDITTTFPEAIKNDDGWARFLSGVTSVEVPTVICDLPAQSTDFVLRQLTERNGLDLLEASGIRLTVLLFPVDDAAARQSAIECVRMLGDRVDWIVVWQPGPKQLVDPTDWANSKLGARLALLNAGQLKLPQLTRLTFEEIQKAVKAENRWMPLSEAIGKVSIVPRHELELWRNHALTGCEDMAHYLIPDPALITAKAARPKLVGTYQRPTGPVFDL